MRLSSLMLFLFMCLIQPLTAQKIDQNKSFRPFIPIEEIFKKAAKENKPVFFEAFLPSCSHCIAYDKTLSSPAIKAYLDKNFHAYQLDLSKPENNAFLRSRKIFIPSTPSFIVFSPQGKVWNIEPVGESTNSVNGIIKLLDAAKNPLQNHAQLVERYTIGERNKENMISAAYFTRLSLDTAKNITLVNDLVKLIKPEEFEGETSFLLIQKVMMDDDNALFHHFITHIKNYQSKFDSVEVKQTAENTIMTSLYSGRARSYSPERLQSLKNGLQAIGLKPQQIAARFIYLEVLIDLDKKLVDQAVARVKNYYGGKAIPEKEKEFWCKLLKKSGSMECLLP
ncbi:hypothetical protein [Aquirufa ecclesiirivi]|uniref:hypothetical protein n=1 Tax=Aquirufa ecclesiirivi TaxID=2715124 RepID=UPI00140A167F|nr:hypothetical protein [Aquirufa ecclesiirivi]NHC48981.1 hypothetical protein [Aquirufa ecclesiirivi]